MKSKLVVKSGNIATRFDEKSVFSTILGFDPHWDYKNYNEYKSQKIVSLGTMDKIHLNCDVIDGSLVNAWSSPPLFSFLLDKLNGYKVFGRPEIFHYEKINETVS